MKDVFGQRLAVRYVGLRLEDGLFTWRVTCLALVWQALEFRMRALSDASSPVDISGAIAVPLEFLH